MADDGNKPDKPDGEANSGEQKPEMLKYRDYRGNIVEFRKPPEPNLLDLLDNVKWGPDEEPIVIPEEELQLTEDESEEEAPSKPEAELTEEEMLELARKKQRRLEKLEERRKIKRAKRKGEVILERIKWEKYDTWNFPKDPDNWTEEDLGEEWADRPLGARGSGFDPNEPDFIPEEDNSTIIPREREKEKLLDQGIEKAWKKIEEKAKRRAKDPSLQEEESDSENEGGYPATAYYVPYRKHYPLIPKVHPEVNDPIDVIDELEKIEEFLVWGSYIFKDGSSYEGTLWDDQAHGRGVYIWPFKLCKYEGEWFQNMMQGHGVLEVNVPVYQPFPDSKLEEEMRAEGYIIKTDYMSPEDREFLKMDIEDTLKQPDSIVTVPQYEDDPLWIEEFGELPEKGRYRYSGQWKHNRMHGCGVYEVNTRPVWGRFYFGELLPESGDCTFEACVFHSGIAEVAAGKARMFAKKPDGMVRRMEGPFMDPDQPYMYEEEDLWMAPGWINAYYEVPDMWKIYVEEVDKEREMWLNSFIKSPLRIPMPSEAEYLWEKGIEFALLTPETSIFDQNSPESQEQILLHVPTGRLLNWTYDKDGNLRMFWQPYKEDGSIKPEEAEFLPEGWDEFFNDAPEEPEKDEDAEFEEQMRRLEEEDEKAIQKMEEEYAALKKKWKEEDEEFEEKLRLIAVSCEEERQAAIQYYKEQKELEEEAAKRAAENVVEAVEETPPTEEEDEAEAEAEEEEEEEDRKPSFGKVEEEDNKSSFRKAPQAQDEDGDEDEDEDEDGKKPPSFGPVAAAEQGTPFSFPTAWASITSAWKFGAFGIRPASSKHHRRVQQAQETTGKNTAATSVAAEPVYVSIGLGRKQHVRLRAVGSSRIRSWATRLRTCRRQHEEVDCSSSRLHSEETSRSIELHLFSLALPVK